MGGRAVYHRIAVYLSISARGRSVGGRVVAGQCITVSPCITVYQLCGWACGGRAVYHSIALYQRLWVGVWRPGAVRRQLNLALSTAANEVERAPLWCRPTPSLPPPLLPLPAGRAGAGRVAAGGRKK